MYDFETATANETCYFMLEKVKQENGKPDQMLMIASLILFNVINTYCLTKEHKLDALKSCYDPLAEGLSATETSDV